MKVLVVGAGMYVTGRRGSGVGTVMASLAQAAGTAGIDEVLVVARGEGGGADVETAARRINTALGTRLRFEYRTVAGSDALAESIALEDYGCAVVVVPDDLHFGFARQLLERRVPALIVKPLTPTLGEARELLAIQSRTGTYAAVEFHKRFDESNLLAKRCLDEGRLGDPVYGTVEYSQRIRIPTESLRSWAGRTNIFQYLGVHYVDLVYFLTGLRPTRAMAVGTRGLLAGRGVDTYDSVHAQILWSRPGNAEHAFVLQLATGWIDPDATSALSDQRIKIIGTRGRIECDQKNRGIEVVTEGGGVEHLNPYFADYLPDPDGRARFQGYGYESIATFLGDVRALAEGRRALADLDRVRPSLRQALVSTAVVEAVNRSLARDGQWEPVDEAG